MLITCQLFALVIVDVSVVLETTVRVSVIVRVGGCEQNKKFKVARFTKYNLHSHIFSMLYILSCKFTDRRGKYIFLRNEYYKNIIYIRINHLGHVFFQVIHQRPIVKMRAYICIPRDAWDLHDVIHKAINLHNHVYALSEYYRRHLVYLISISEYRSVELGDANDEK